MNYILLINDFWIVNETNNFKSNEIALYFYLLRVNNSCFWKTKFSHNNYKIMAAIGISFNTLKNARDKLKLAGLIEFETKNGVPNVNYSILTSSKFDEVSNEVSDEVSNEVSDEIKKTKPNQTKPSFKKEAKVDNFNFKKSLISYGANELLVLDWLKVRKTKRATNSESAYNGIIKEIEESKKPIDDILTLCITKDWKGFEAKWLNNLENNNKNNNNYSQTPASDSYESGKQKRS